MKQSCNSTLYDGSLKKCTYEKRVFVLQVINIATFASTRRQRTLLQKHPFFLPQCNPMKFRIECNGMRIFSYILTSSSPKLYLVVRRKTARGTSPFAEMHLALDDCKPNLATKDDPRVWPTQRHKVEFLPNRIFRSFPLPSRLLLLCPR